MSRYCSSFLDNLSVVCFPHTQAEALHLSLHRCELQLSRRNELLRKTTCKSPMASRKRIQKTTVPTKMLKIEWQARKIHKIWKAAVVMILGTRISYPVTVMRLQFMHMHRNRETVYFIFF